MRGRLSLKWCFASGRPRDTSAPTLAAPSPGNEAFKGGAGWGNGGLDAEAGGGFVGGAESEGLAPGGRQEIVGLGLGLGGGDELEGPGAAKDDAPHLERRLGLISGVALIVGTMIGSGIFVSPAGLLVRTGSVGLSLIVWIACGVLSLLGALAYAELGTMNTSSGAEYAYLMDAFGPATAYLFSWTSTLVLKPSQMAIIVLSFAQYAVQAFSGTCDPPPHLVKLVAIFATAIILFINCYSVKLATGVQNAFTAAKLAAILIIIVGGAYKVAEGNTKHLANPFVGTTNSLGSIATAFYTGLWAYDGWNNLNYVTEEIVNPSVNLPRSIIIGIPLVTMCYFFINISYLTVMSAAELIESEAVAVAIITSAMVLSGTIDSLIDFFSFAAWIFYGSAMLALIVMRFTKKDAPRPYKVPIIIPLVVLVISVYLIAAPIIDNPQIEYLYAGLFILAGLLLYVPFVHYHYVPAVMEKITVFFQLLCEVSPTQMTFD